MNDNATGRSLSPDKADHLDFFTEAELDEALGRSRPLQRAGAAHTGLGLGQSPVQHRPRVHSGGDLDGYYVFGNPVAVYEPATREVLPSPGARSAGRPAAAGVLWAMVTAVLAVLWLLDLAALAAGSVRAAVLTLAVALVVAIPATRALTARQTRAV